MGVANQPRPLSARCLAELRPGAVECRLYECFDQAFSSWLDVGITELRRSDVGMTGRRASEWLSDGFAVNRAALWTCVILH